MAQTAAKIIDPSGNAASGYIENGKTYVVGNDGKPTALPIGWSVTAGNGNTYQMTAQGGVKVAQPTPATDLQTKNTNAIDSTTTTLDGLAKSLQDLIASQGTNNATAMAALAANRAKTSQQLSDINSPEYLSNLVTTIMQKLQPLADSRTNASNAQYAQANQSLQSSMDARGLVNSGVAPVLENDLAAKKSAAVDAIIAELQGQATGQAQNSIGNAIQSIGMQGDWAGSDAGLGINSFNDMVNNSMQGLGMQGDWAQNSLNTTINSNKDVAGLTQDQAQFDTKLKTDTEQFNKTMSQDWLKFSTNLNEQSKQYFAGLAQEMAMHKDDMGFKYSSLSQDAAQFNKSMNMQQQQMNAQNHFDQMAAMNQVAQQRLAEHQYTDEKSMMNDQKMVAKTSYATALMEEAYNMMLNNAPQSDVEAIVNGSIMYNKDVYDDGFSNINDFVTQMYKEKASQSTTPAKPYDPANPSALGIINSALEAATPILTPYKLVRDGLDPTKWK